MGFLIRLSVCACLLVVSNAFSCPNKTIEEEFCSLDFVSKLEVLNETLMNTFTYPDDNRYSRVEYRYTLRHLTIYKQPKNEALPTQLFSSYDNRLIYGIRLAEGEYSIGGRIRNGVIILDPCDAFWGDKHSILGNISCPTASPPPQHDSVASTTVEPSIETDSATSTEETTTIPQVIVPSTSTDSDCPAPKYPVVDEGVHGVLQECLNVLTPVHYMMFKMKFYKFLAETVQKYKSEIPESLKDVSD